MLAAKASDKEWIVDVISDAFGDNKSALWVVKNDGAQNKRIRRLISYAFERSHRSGGAFINQERTGAMLFLDPDGAVNGMKNTLDDLRLAFNAVGIERSLKVLRRERYVERQHPKEPFIYLWFIGVKNDAQNSGVGSEMMRELIDEAERRRLPILLETSAPISLAFYEKSGFEIYHEWNDGFLGFPLWFMRRMPSSAV